MKNTMLIFALIFGLSGSLSAQKEKAFVRKGNKAYRAGKYESAAQQYRKGVEENAYSYEANFNLGTALYQQEEYESAAQQFDLLRQPDTDPQRLARAYHNLGNSLLEQKKYAESVEAFKKALRNNPNDPDTRYNLVYAMEKLQEQQQQQQNQQNQEQDQQEENQEQNDQQQQQEQQNGEQEQQQQKEGENGQSQQQQAQTGEISRKEAERILQALNLDEQKLHRLLDKKKAKGTKAKILKNW